MKVILCGSISVADEIRAVRDSLLGLGHEVEIPTDVKTERFVGRKNATTEEIIEHQIRHDAIRDHYEKMKLCDTVLIVNAEKKGIKGYVGVNTFLEMAFAHVLKKKLFCLNALPDMFYTPEMIALQPVILNGDLTRLK